MRGPRKDTHSLTVAALRQQRTDARRRGDVKRMGQLTVSIDACIWAHAYLAGRPL